MTPAEELLIRSIPQALAVTERVCGSVNVGSTKTGINMDAVKLMGEIVLKLQRHPKNRIPLDVRNLLCSVMRQMITRLWLVLSMELQKLTASLM